MYTNFFLLFYTIVNYETEMEVGRMGRSILRRYRPPTTSIRIERTEQFL